MEDNITGIIKSDKVREIFFRRITRYAASSPLILVLLGVGLFLTLTTRSFLTSTNLLNVLRQSSFVLLLGIAQTFIIISGGVDLSVGTGLSLSGCIAALVMLRFGIYPGIAAGIATGVALGLVNGFLVYELRMPPIIATLGTMTIAGGLSLYSTGGAIIFGLPKQFMYLGQGYISVIPIPVLISILALAFGIFLLAKTRFGIQVCAVGGNFEATRLSGINTRRVYFFVYLFSGILAAITGLIMTARVSSAQPAYGKGYELLSVAAVVIGGTSLFGGEGDVWKTAVGAILLGVLSNGLNLLGVRYYWHDVVTGAVIIIAVAFDRMRTRGVGNKQ